MKTTDDKAVKAKKKTPRTLPEFRAWLAAMGATLDEGDYTHYADAKLGYKWANTDTTVIAIHWKNEGGQTWLGEAIKSAVEDCSGGMEKCTPEETADVNNNHGRGGEGQDPSWEAPADAPEFIRP